MLTKIHTLALISKGYNQNQLIFKQKNVLKKLFNFCCCNMTLQINSINLQNAPIVTIIYQKFQKFPEYMKLQYINYRHAFHALLTR